jgi:UDP-N-acetylglucosamine acyltransferase
MPKISPLAAVDPKAILADDVEVGPFCVIGPDVRIGAGTRLANSVTVIGHTTLGTGNVIYPNAVLGAAPQDKKYRGEATRLEVGNNNQIREAATLHIGTGKGGGVTRIGDDNLLMVNCHLGHDVQLGNHCILANNVMLAGHVVVGDFVAMMGGVGIHHFVTVGQYAYIGGYARIHHDVPPFVKVDGADQVRGLNSIGLKRAGVSEADVEILEDVVRSLFYNREKPFSVMLGEFEQQYADPSVNGASHYVRQIVSFLRRRDQGRHGRYLESLRAK